MTDSAPILEAVGILLAESDDRLAQTLAAMETAWLQRMDDRLAQLPLPEPGRDGVDRVEFVPRWIKEGEACEVNTIGVAEGGIWQAVRATNGGPADDPGGWRCMVPGYRREAEMRVDMQRREIVIGLRMSDGYLHECRGRMPATQLPPDFVAQGWGVLAGDTLRDESGDSEMLALVDGADPENPEQWRICRLRGFRGQKGPRGDPGPRGIAGPGLAGMALAEDRQSGRLVLVPKFADASVKAEPIAIDLMVNDPPAGKVAITCWGGRWTAAKTYTRGEIVSDGQGRNLISLKSNNNAALHDGRAWEAMTDAA